MKKETTSTAPALGSCSLVVIFGVLCLTVFALLSLSTVLAQQRLAEGALDSVTAYYTADLQAEEIFARLRAGERPAQVSQEGAVYSYSVPLTRHQTLYVELEKTGESWTVLRWQAEADPLTINDTLPVWNGQ